MTFEEFISKVENAVRSCLGKECGLCVEKVMKNNGVELTGLIFMKTDSDIASTIYLDSFYEAYEKGRTMGETVRKILETYEDGKPGERMNLSFFSDYSQVRSRLACRLVSFERNAALLLKTPYRRVLDLAKVYHCVLVRGDLGCASILINNAHLAAWGIPEEELVRDAETNMTEILPPSLSSMGEFFRDMMKETLNGRTGDPLLPEYPSGGRMPEDLARVWEDCGRQMEHRMLILSNTQHFYGASALLYPGLLKELAEEQKCGLFVLPSSVHEVILLADSGREDAQSLSGMVREVNRENVPREEFLSDHVYYYDKEGGLRIRE